MALLKHATQPNRYIRVTRNSAWLGIPETSRKVDATYDENGNVLVAEHTVIVPASSRLVAGWREWKTADDRELNKTTEEVWSRDGTKTYSADQIILPPATWTPKEGSTEDVATQYLVALIYLTMLADPQFASEWISDES